MKYLIVAMLLSLVGCASSGHYYPEGRPAGSVLVSQGIAERTEATDKGTFVVQYWWYPQTGWTAHSYRKVYR